MNAIYQANVIYSSLFSFVNFRTVPWIYDVQFMSISWVDGDGNLGGHAVCLISWSNGTYSALDYGMPWAAKLTPTDVAQQVVNVYSKGLGTPLCYARYDVKLRMHELRWLRDRV